MKRSGVHIGNVHRYLSNTVFLDEPADSLAAFKCSRDPDGFSVLIFEDLACRVSAFSCLTSFFTYIESDSGGSTGRCGIQVKVDSDKEISCSDIGSTRLGHCFIVYARAEIRFACRIRNFLRESLIFTCSTNSKVLSSRGKCCCLIAVACYTEFIIDAFCKTSCPLCTFLESSVRNRNERENIGST